MTISKRQLNKWRKESLQQIQKMKKGEIKSTEIIYHERILKLTQTLIDQHLIKENQ